MSSDVQTHNHTNSGGNSFIEISMVVVFVSIIILSCLVLLFGS